MALTFKGDIGLTDLHDQSGKEPSDKSSDGKGSRKDKPSVTDEITSKTGPDLKSDSEEETTRSPEDTNQSKATTDDVSDVTTDKDEDDEDSIPDGKHQEHASVDSDSDVSQNKDVHQDQQTDSEVATDQADAANAHSEVDRKDPDDRKSKDEEETRLETNEVFAADVTFDNKDPTKIYAPDNEGEAAAAGPEDSESYGYIEPLQEKDLQRESKLKNPLFPDEVQDANAKQESSGINPVAALAAAISSPEEERTQQQNENIDDDEASKEEKRAVAARAENIQTPFDLNVDDRGRSGINPVAALAAAISSPEEARIQQSTNTDDGDDATKEEKGAVAALADNIQAPFDPNVDDQEYIPSDTQDSDGNTKSRKKKKKKKKKKDKEKKKEKGNMETDETVVKEPTVDEAYATIPVQNENAYDNIDPTQLYAAQPQDPEEGEASGSKTDKRGKKKGRKQHDATATSDDFGIQFLGRRPRSDDPLDFLVKSIRPKDVAEVKKELFEAVQGDRIDQVKKLLKRHKLADDTLVGHEQNCICHSAARHGSIKVLREYGKRLVGLHFRNNLGDTWLHEAARWGQIDAARYIIDHFRREVLQFVWNKNEETVIDVAISTACYDFVRGLDYEYVRKVTKKDFGKTIMHVIAANGLIDLIDDFSFADVQKQDGFQDTPLHTAAKNKHYGTLNKLMTKVEESFRPKLINMQNEDMETVLHIAGKQANVEAIESLITRGADIQMQNFVDNTPMHEFMSSTEVKTESVISLVDMLVENNPKPDVVNVLHMRNKAGQKLLHVASQKSDVDVVKRLIHLDADLAKKDETVESSLLFDLVASTAIQEDKFVDLVSGLDETLLKDIHEKYPNESVLHVIAASGLTDLVTKFAFVEPDKLDRFHDTVLHTAAKNKHFDTLKELVNTFATQSTFMEKELGQVLAIQNDVGESVLHIASKQADIEMTEYLIEKGSDISVKDYTSNTPLHYLVSSTEITAEQSVAFMRKMKESELKELQHVKNLEGETVLQIASKQTKVEVVDYLMKVDRDHKAVGDIHTFPIFEMLSSPDILTEKAIEFIQGFKDEDLQEVVRNEPERDKTLLHVIAGRGLTPLVRKFTFIDITKQDEVDDTALHTAARYKHFETLKELMDAYKEKEDFKATQFIRLLEMKNSEGETVLHIASRQANIDIVAYLLKQGADLSIQDESDNTPLHHLILSAEIQAERSVKFINEELKDDVVKKAVAIDTKRKKERLGDSFETVLHMIAASGLTELVRKFSFIDLNQQDRFKDSVLHTAARHRHFPTLAELVAIISNKPNFDDSVLEELLNLKNEEGETVLHLATKHTSLEIVEYLIRHGADLAAQDHTGNTPLHDLIDKAANDETNIDEYVSVWHVFVKNIVFWWCSRFGLSRPYKSSDEYRIYQRDAVYYLRSEIPNRQYLSVIQLAATKGLVRFVKEMIWVDEVFVRQLELEKDQSEEDRRVEIDVTNLMPDFGGGNEVKYMRKAKYYPMGDFKRNSFEGQRGAQFQSKEEGKDVDISFDDLKDIDREDIRDCCCSCFSFDEGFDGDRCLGCGLRTCCLPCFICFLFSDNLKLKKQHSLMDAILKVKQGNKANEVFEIEPMKQLVRDYWFVHQWWTVLMLVIHLIFMTIYSSYSLDTIRKAFQASASPSMSGDIGVSGVFIIWPVTLVIPDIIVVLGFPVRYMVTKGTKRKYLKERVIGETNIDVKDIFNWPSVLLAFMVVLIPFLLPLMFCVSTIVAIAATEYDSTFFNNMTTISLVLGWLLSFYWASAFEPVYRFVSALKIIILKDVLSFLFFYIFVLLAYANAMYVTMSTVPSLVGNYTTLNEVMFELLLLGCGADSRMSAADLTEQFEEAKQDSTLFEFLFASYIIVTMVGLLNLIIASMCDSYNGFTQTDNQGWRQHCLKLSRRSIISFFICSELLRPIFKKLKIVEKSINVDKGGHYTIKMSYKQATLARR